MTARTSLGILIQCSFRGVAVVWWDAPNLRRQRRLRKSSNSYTLGVALFSDRYRASSVRE